MAISHKVFSSRALNVNSATYVGEAGRLFYEQTTGTGIAPVLKYSDGVTPGGLPLSGGSLTFSSNTPPLNPTDGILWWNTNDGRLYIYYDNSWVDASPDVQGAVTEIIAGPGISINTSTGAVTITATGGNGNGYTGSAGTNGTNGYTGSAGTNGTNGYTGSRGTTGYVGSQGTAGYNGSVGYTGSQGTTGYVGSQGPIGPNVAATNNSLGSVIVGNNIDVDVLGTISIPQNLSTTATIRFGDLTVNNLNVLNTITNVTPAVVEGYRLYLASTATTLGQINGGGIQLGSTATGLHSIFWDSAGYWDTDGDGIKTLTLQATTSTLGTLEVLNQARFGYVNQDLTLANAYIQVDSNSDNFSQIAIVNHNTGTNASADIVATNDIGDDSSGFIDMGINSSVFNTSSWTVNGANDGYLYVAGGNLAIGTNTPDKNIVFFTGGVDSSNIVATITTSSVNVDAINSLNSSTLSLNLSNNGSVSVNTLNIPVGTILGSNTSTIYTLAQLTLTNVVAYSTLTTDTLVAGEYGLLNGVPAPYAVYEFTQTPDPALQVGDLLSGSGIPNILPGTSVGFTGTVVLAVGTGTYSNYVVGYSDYSVLPPPTPGIAVLVGRNTLNANLSITTQPVTDIGLFPGVGGNIVAGSSIIPLVNDTYDLGSPGKRWRHVWVGAGTIYILDETLGTDTAIGAKDGVVYLEGGVGLNVGEFTFRDNQIKIADPTRDILVGSTTATGKVIFNRPITVNTPAGQSTFTVDRLGLTKINPPTSLASTQSALSIVGNASGIQQPRNFNNTMLQITGADNTSTRVSIDSFGTGVYPVIAGRQAGGTVSAPSQTKSGDTLLRFSAQGWGTTGYVSTIARINQQAAQDFTDTAAGTRVRFQLTPLNTTTIQTVSADITAEGLSLVGNSTGGVRFRDNTFQITAFTSTNAVTRLTAGTGTHVSTSTGNITVWIDPNFGPIGYTGSVGITGYTGSFGITGYTGSFGITGYTGSFGITGYTGSASTVSGPQGYSGSVGLTGYTGSVPGPYVSSITAGTGTQVSTSTGAVTVWTLPAQSITTTATSTSTTGLTVDLSGPTFITWQPTANGTRTITLTGFTPGRKVELWITPHGINDVFTVTGVTTGQCSDGVNTFTLNGVGASQQKSFILQIYCTTNAIGGVWIYGNGTL